MPQFRFTVRWMMVAVAIVAVLLESWIVWRRFTFHRHQAVLTARTEAGLRRSMIRYSPAQLLTGGTSLDFEDGKPSVPMTLENCERMLARMEQVKRHHEYAARHPWLFAVPEPPEAR